MSCVDPQRLIMTRHVLDRMSVRGISWQDVEHVARHHTIAFTQGNGSLNREATLPDGRRLLVAFVLNGSSWIVKTAYFRGDTT